MSSRKHKMSGAEDKKKAEEAKRKAVDPSFDLLTTLSPSQNKPVATKSCQITDADIKDIKEGAGGYRIEGRVSNKSFIRDYMGAKSGRAFSFELMDDTSTIRVTIFNSIMNFIDIFNEIQVNQVISLENFRVEPKNPLYNLTPHPLEAYWTNDSIYNDVEDNFAYPAIEFKFTSLVEVVKCDPGTLVDVIGIAAKVGELQDVSTGQIRTVTLVDTTGARIDLTLWHGAAVQANLVQGDVLAVKQAKIKTYNRIVSLNLEWNSVFWSTPKIPAALELSEWMIKILKK